MRASKTAESISPSASSISGNRRAQRCGRRVTDLALNYNLHYSEPRDTVLVDADPVRIGTILRNLLDNAIKYSPDGGTIECRLEVEPGFAVVTVADEGVGLAEEDISTLFRRFSRGNSGAIAGGVGLGLYICRTLAELHGGTIEARRRPVAGSEFIVRLPRKEN